MYGGLDSGGENGGVNGGGPVITRATMRVEWSGGEVRTFDVPNPQRVNLYIAGPELEPVGGDYRNPYRIPAPGLARHVEMSMDAELSRRENVITISDGPDPLLDWPVSIDLDEVWCAKADCALGTCGSGHRSRICDLSEMTAGSLLAAVRKHAEGTRP